jgi:type IV secretory pathway ATPase VirB11/archaellum biosynthesis ATPase
MPGAHKNDTATFDELDDDEQTKSINMHIINLKRMIDAHEKRVISQGKASEKTKCVVNILKMVMRLL